MLMHFELEQYVGTVVFPMRTTKILKVVVPKHFTECWDNQSQPGGYGCLYRFYGGGGAAPDKCRAEESKNCSNTLGYQRVRSNFYIPVFNTIIISPKWNSFQAREAAKTRSASNSTTS